MIRTGDGRREVEEWGLKVQKLANVHSVTLLFVSSFLEGMRLWGCGREGRTEGKEADVGRVRR